MGKFRQLYERYEYYSNVTPTVVLLDFAMSRPYLLTYGDIIERFDGGTT